MENLCFFSNWLTLLSNPRMATVWGKLKSKNLHYRVPEGSLPTYHSHLPKHTSLTLLARFIFCWYEIY